MIKMLVLAMLCESVWQSIKMIYQKDKYLTISNVGALIVALLICISTNLDIFIIFKIDSSIPYLGIVLTAILLSRGSNFIHDLLDKMKDISSTKEA